MVVGVAAALLPPKKEMVPDLPFFHFLPFIHFFIFTMCFFLAENARIHCKFFARSTRNAPKLRPASLRKYFNVAEFLRRFAGACNAENARIQRSNMRKTLPNFASMTHEFAAKFSPFRRAAQQSVRFFLQRFRS